MLPDQCSRIEIEDTPGDGEQRWRAILWTPLPGGAGVLLCLRKQELGWRSQDKEERMPKTPQDFLEEARRDVLEVSVEEVAMRRTRGDEVVLLDVREKDEVRAGYIEGAVTIPRGFLEFHVASQLPQTG